MNANEIKRMRTESVLKELIPEALATLEDGILKGLCVTDVECKKGRYDAFVYLGHLKRVCRHLQNHCMAAEGWYRCPNFHFKFDDRLEYQNHMDKLFDKISKDLNKNG